MFAWRLSVLRKRVPGLMPKRSSLSIFFLKEKHLFISHCKVCWSTINWDYWRLKTTHYWQKSNYWKAVETKKIYYMRENFKIIHCNSKNMLQLLFGRGPKYKIHKNILTEVSYENSNCSRVRDFSLGFTTRS